MKTVSGQQIRSHNSLDESCLLSALFAEQTPLQSGRSLIPSNLMWENLFQAAENELILPALHSRLQELGALDQVPAEAKSFLAAVEDLNLERNERIFSELTAVVSLLNQAGIEPVLLKGAAYCLTGVYKNPATRYLWDLDLLVPKPQLLTAVQVLSQSGFELDCTDSLALFRHHHPTLRRNGSGFFEMHHSLGMGVCTSLLPASEVLEQSVATAFRGARMRVPSPTHLMIHLIMHSQVQHPYKERIWPPLRAMYDLQLLRSRFDKEIDWNSIRNRFRKLGQTGVLTLHLLQVQDTLGSEPPFAIPLTGLTHLRWRRRKLLRSIPPLRFLDPIYVFSTVLRRRLRLLRSAIATPGGRKRIAVEVFAPGVYKRIATELIQGRGR